MRRSRPIILIALLLSTFLCAPFPVMAAPINDAPLPNDLVIEKPDPSISSDLAAFSGKWTGRSSNSGRLVRMAFLIKLTEDAIPSVTAYYAWNTVLDSPKGFVKTEKVMYTNGVVWYRLGGDITIRCYVPSGNAMNCDRSWYGGSSIISLIREEKQTSN